MGKDDKPVEPSKPQDDKDKVAKEKEKAERVKKIKEAKDFIEKTKPKMTIASGDKVREVDAKIIIGKLKRD